ncbi:MAG: hypothetical protein ACNA8K_14775 [Cyclonatronaceae bacterium]
MTNDKVSIEERRNRIAAIQSIIPGLGHIYKGHFWLGAIILLLSPLVLWAGLMLGWATFGFGLFLPLAFIAFIAYQAYHLEDRRKHHAGVL